MKIDYKLLQEDIKFPIKEDPFYHSYIWDSQNNMIAQFEEESTEKEYHTILGDMIEFTDEQINNTSKYKLEKGDFIRQLDFELIGCVRGWGRLKSSGVNNPEQRQDNIALYLLTCLNNK